LAFYSVKYLPSDAMRQSYWRSKLNGEVSRARLLEALIVAGLPVSIKHVNGFFKMDPKGDKLTIEEAIIFLEECVVAEMKSEEGSAATAVVVKAEPETVPSKTPKDTSGFDSQAPGFPLGATASPSRLTLRPQPRGGGVHMTSIGAAHGVGEVST
jgi:hypothetical protein